MTHPFAAYLDLANHHANATPEDIKTLCANVLEYGFNSAFVNPYYITVAKETLAGKGKVGTAFSFPLGQDTQANKLAATKECIALGADELDIVPNNGLLLSDKGFGIYRQELKEIVDTAKSASPDVIVKFIIETGFFLPGDPNLSQEKKRRRRNHHQARSRSDIGKWSRLCKNLFRHGTTGSIFK